MVEESDGRFRCQPREEHVDEQILENNQGNVVCSVQMSPETAQCNTKEYWSEDGIRRLTYDEVYMKSLDSWVDKVVCFFYDKNLKPLVNVTVDELMKNLKGMEVNELEELFLKCQPICDVFASLIMFAAELAPFGKPLSIVIGFIYTRGAQVSLTSPDLSIFQ